MTVSSTLFIVCSIVISHEVFCSRDYSHFASQLTQNRRDLVSNIDKRVIWLRRRFNIPLLNALRPRPSGLDDDMKTRFFHVYGKRSSRPSLAEEQLSRKFPQQDEWTAPTIDAIEEALSSLEYADTDDLFDLNFRR